MEIFDIAEGLKDKYLEFLKDVVRIESPTEYKKGVDECGRYFAEKAKELGWDVKVYPMECAGDMVVITQNADVDAEPIVLSGHLDTVQPLGFFGLDLIREIDGKVYGPGIMDCKGGCVCGFWAMEVMQKMGYKKRPIMLILQSDEETTSRQSNGKTIEIMGELSKNCVGFFNLEPCSRDDRGVTLERKGTARYRVITYGKLVHSAKCETGVSAIVEAAKIICELEKFKDTNGITCNCGMISGGVAENTVPDRCEFSVDVRYKNEEEFKKFDEIVRGFEKKSFLEGAKTEVIHKSKRTPMPRTEQGRELLEKLNKSLKNHGLNEVTGNYRPGGSDAACMAVLGIPAIDSIGIVGAGGHSEREHIILSEFSLSTKRLVSVIEEL